MNCVGKEGTRTKRIWTTSRAGLARVGQEQKQKLKLLVVFSIHQVTKYYQHIFNQELRERELHISREKRNLERERAKKKKKEKKIEAKTINIREKMRTRTNK